MWFFAVDEISKQCLPSSFKSFLEPLDEKEEPCFCVCYRVNQNLKASLSFVETKQRFGEWKGFATYRAESGLQFVTEDRHSLISCDSGFFKVTVETDLTVSEIPYQHSVQ